MIPDQAKLKEARLQRCLCVINLGFTYNPENGKIYNRKGKEIISKDKRGYSRITISINNKKSYLKGHHFAWYWVHKECVDFIVSKSIKRNGDY